MNENIKILTHLCSPSRWYAHAPSPADCEVSAQITGAKKQDSLGSLSRDKLTPILCVRALQASVLPGSPRWRSTRAWID